MRKVSLQLSAFIMTLLLSMQAMAQDGAKKLDVDINVNKGGEASGLFSGNNIYFWIIGGLIFILLLVALLRGGGNKN